MNFFFKSNKIVLDCFTDNHLVYETAKINHASKFMPQWWKDLPLVKGNTPIDKLNMKTCPGFHELFKKSLVIPSWSEMHFLVHPDGRYEWRAANEVKIVDHPQFQYDGWLSNSKFSHLKINSPWFAKSKDDLPLLFLEPFWNNTSINGVRIIPGILNTKYTFQLNINGLIEPNPSTDKVVLIEPLTPLTFLVPLTDKKIELRHHLVSEKEIKRFTDFHFFPSLNILSNRKKIVKRMEELDKKDSKCPFGFK